MNRKGFSPAATAVVGIILITAIFVIGSSVGWRIPGAVGVIPPGGCEDPGTARTISIVGLDNQYNIGSAITAVPFFYRKVGETTWTDPAGKTFSATAGAQYELALGVNATTSTTAEPQPVTKYRDTITVPCDYSKTFEYTFTNDALSTDVSASALDPADGNVISSTDTIDIDLGASITIPLKIYSSDDENYGTMACGLMSNVYVVRINTTSFEEENTDLKYNGVSLAKTGSPSVLSSSTGLKDIAFIGPVLESTRDNSAYKFSLVVDPTDTGDGYNPTGNTDNTTVYIYDSHIYYDNNDNTFKCGVEDETGSEIGAATPDSLTIYTAPDA